MNKWVEIENYEGLYKISSNGEVISIKKNIVMKQRLKRDGYMQIGLWKNGKKKYYVVHRLVAKAFIENTNNYNCVNHKDENKTNNSVDNL